VRGQVCKRLSRRLGELGLPSLDRYRIYLDAHPAEWDVLDGLCRITISRFYRDRGSTDRTVDCWSAGCGSGEEPYSVSLAWDLEVAETVPDVDLRILGTDADPHLLERARAACYPSGALKELPEPWIAIAFESSDDELRLLPSYRRRVELLRQDIRLEMPTGPFDLVLCRNLVFTYFDASLQAELLPRILERLRPRGILVLGSHETLPPGDWPLDRPFGTLPIHRRISGTDAAC